MQTYIQFFLNSDGMVNIHPQIPVDSSNNGRYYFTMTENEFLHYLSKHGIHVDNQFEKILDNEDGYQYGQVL